MATHPLPDLLSLWRKGDLTADQMIGHLLQHQIAWQQWRTAIEKRLHLLEQARPSSATTAPDHPQA
jgi:hypothetical protein